MDKKEVESPFGKIAQTDNGDYVMTDSQVYEQFEKEFRGFCESDCIRAFCERHRISLRLVYVTEQPTDDALVTETRYRSAP